jgi:hypothetical protein
MSSNPVLWSSRSGPRTRPCRLELPRPVFARFKACAFLASQELASNLSRCTRATPIRLYLSKQPDQSIARSGQNGDNSVSLSLRLLKPRESLVIDMLRVCRNLYAPPDRFPERVTPIECITALFACVSLYRRIRGGLLSLLLRIQQHRQV